MTTAAPPGGGPAVVDITVTVLDGGAARLPPTSASDSALPSAHAAWPAALVATRATETAAAEAIVIAACPSGLQVTRACKCRALQTSSTSYSSAYLFVQASMPFTALTTRRHSGDRMSVSRVDARITAMSSTLIQSEKDRGLIDSTEEDFY